MVQMHKHGADRNSSINLPFFACLVRSKAKHHLVLDFCLVPCCIKRNIHDPGLFFDLRLFGCMCKICPQHLVGKTLQERTLSYKVARLENARLRMSG